MSNTSNNPYPPDLNDNNSNVSVSKNDVADRQFPDNFNPVSELNTDVFPVLGFPMSATLICLLIDISLLLAITSTLTAY